MAYCPNCGVELAAEATKCPLCGAKAVGELSPEERASRASASLASRPKGDSHQGGPDRGPDGDSHQEGPEGGSRGDSHRNGEEAQARERNTLRWEVLSVSALISAIAVCAVDLLTSGRLSWALYPLFSLAFVWVELSALIELRGLPLLGLPLAFASLPLYLLALDLVDGRLDWAWPVGMPIAVIVELAFGLALLVAALLRWKPLLSLALLLLAATLSCLGIDGSLSLAAGGALRFTWSGIVAAAVVPVSGFLVYVHFRVLRIARLRRLFHM